MSVYDSARAYQERVQRMETQVLVQLTRVYLRNIDRLNAQIRQLTRQVAAQKASGEPVTKAWALERAQTLLALVGQAAADYAVSLNGAVTAAQREAIALSISGAESTVRQLGIKAGWVAVNRDAVQAIVGMTSSGPLEDLLRGFAQDAQEAVTDAIIDGVVQSENPRKTARLVALEIQRTLPDDLRRAYARQTLLRSERIVRTETMRAYRIAGQQAWMQNPGIVHGWEWLSARSDRTCAYCWAMDGTEHPLGEPMATHPNCRCTQLPITRPLAPASVTPQVTPDQEAARARFDALPEKARVAILGKQGAAAYAAGDAKLDDWVETSYSPLWGMTGYQAAWRTVAAKTGQHAAA